MTVKIVKSTISDSWYVKLIGCIFRVREDCSNNRYYVRKDGFGFIRKDDCVILAELDDELDPKLFEV